MRSNNPRSIRQPLGQMRHDENLRQHDELIADEWRGVCGRCDLLCASVYLFVNTVISGGLMLYFQR